jgi:glycosyltransferase involved in cell wall biosynthesis
MLLALPRATRAVTFSAMGEDMLRVVFIIESEESAAARYRVLLNAEAFEAQGVDIYPMMLPRRRRARAKLFRDVEDYDVVVLQRRLLQWWDLRALRRRVRVLGYDFDDALMFRDGGRGRFNSISRRWKFASTMRSADFVTAGNRCLWDMCPVEDSRKFIVATPVDTDVYRPRPEDAGGGVLRIGWVGSASTLKYLEAVLPAIARAARRADFELAVIADKFPPEAPFIRRVEWHERTEQDEVARFDVGLMPLEDNPWTRGKCGFKLLLYGACGIPSVASPVGVNREIISDGETGILADSPARWEDAVVRLASDAEERRAMGAAARARVAGRYSSRLVVPTWADILKDFAGRRQPRLPNDST